MTDPVTFFCPDSRYQRRCLPGPLRLTFLLILYVFLRRKRIFRAFCQDRPAKGGKFFPLYFGFSKDSVHSAGRPCRFPQGCLDADLWSLVFGFFVLEVLHFFKGPVSVPSKVQLLLWAPPRSLGRIVLPSGPTLSMCWFSSTFSQRRWRSWPP